MRAQGCETAWEKAFEMKRGPPYKRKLDQWHVNNRDDERIASVMNTYIELSQDPSDVGGNLPKNLQGTRVHWAMGVLSVAEHGDEKQSRHISGIQPSKGP